MIMYLLDGLPLSHLWPHLVQVDELLDMIGVQNGPLFGHDVSSYGKHCALRQNRSGGYRENIPTHKQSHKITGESR